MGQPVHLPVRERLISLRAEGHTVNFIAQEVGLSFWTVRHLLRRHNKKGSSGCAPDYTSCGAGGRLRADYFFFRASRWLKRLHLSWGAPFIRMKLAQRYGEAGLPSSRQMQRWFRQCGLNEPRQRKGEPKAGKAQAVHDCWQVDAKERLVLAGGQPCSYLSVVDEHSGSSLGAVLFPLPPDKPNH
jgi:hypothetical protein